METTKEVIRTRVRELREVDPIYRTTEQKIELFGLVEELRVMSGMSSQPHICDMDNLKIEFMGGGFLTTCPICNKIF